MPISPVQLSNQTRAAAVVMGWYDQIKKDARPRRETLPDLIERVRRAIDGDDLRSLIGGPFNGPLASIGPGPIGHPYNREIHAGY